MNPIKAIIARKSCRTFNGLHLDPAVLGKINALCRELSTSPQASEPRIFNRIPRPEIKLLSDFSASGLVGTYGVIKGARSFLAMAGGDTPRRQLLAGYLFEQIVLTCTAEGLDTCWLGGTFGQSGFQAEFDKPGTSQRNSPATPCPVTIVSPLGHRTPHTRFAERIMRKIVSADTRKPFPDLFTGIDAPRPDLMQRLADDTCNGTTLQEAISTEEKVAVMLECVRLAPSSTNSQPWRANVCRNLKGKITGIAMSCAATGKFATYDMGIAYRHLLDSARMLGINGVLEENSDTDPTQLFFSLLS